MKPHDVARLTEISVKMMRGCLPFFMISLIVYAICSSHGAPELAIRLSTWGIGIFGVGCLPMVILILIFGIGWFIEN